MISHTIEKTVAERKTLTLDASGLCPSGVAVSTCAVSAIARSTLAADNTVIVDTAPTPSGNTVDVTLYQGSDGESYLVNAAFTLDNNDVKEVYILLNVLNVP